MKITKSLVDKLQLPDSDNQKRYYDDMLKGFGVRVTSSGIKAFFLETMINGTQKRITLGRYPSLTVEMARREAKKTLGIIAMGIDPIADKKAQKAKGVTLQQAFDDYLKARKSLKPTTILDYKRVFNQVIPDWQNKPLLNITKDMVIRRHQKYGSERSQARANLAMRVLRAIYNFAAGEYEDSKGKSLVVENPVKRLSHTRAWYRVDRRQTVIKRHELAAWYQGLQALSNVRDDDKVEMMQDYMLLILFTGLRRSEAASLQWDNIDFNAKTLTIDDTKNHERHTMPLSDFLLSLFKRREQESNNQYVFPANSATGYLVEPRKSMLRVRELSGVVFTLHDLRRTFITIAESLDIPVYALKRLLNHKMSADVTAGYVVIDVERLRKPMQMITDHLLVLMEVKKGAKVLQFRGSKLTNVTH